MIESHGVGRLGRGRVGSIGSRLGQGGVNAGRAGGNWSGARFGLVDGRLAGLGDVPKGSITLGDVEHLAMYIYKIALFVT
jgi:hypothetical protein